MRAGCRPGTTLNPGQGWNDKYSRGQGQGHCWHGTGFVSSARELPPHGENAIPAPGSTALHHAAPSPQGFPGIGRKWGWRWKIAQHRVSSADGE